ncbi:hypothetical protein [Leifsonia poae]|uniref:hypothetical protein n=1 Tax=Leifsonia poae TaxID=110933 RepID=UPI001CC052D7|nr:hypothetical protein [Leifsonia poae]
MNLPGWFIDWAGDVTLAQVVIWIAIIVFLIWILRKSWPGLRAAIKLTDILSALPAFMEQTKNTLSEQDQKIAEIHHETHNNNGSSIKDSTDRIELGVRGLFDRVGILEETTRSLITSDAELRKDTANLRREFDDTHPRSAIEHLRDNPTQQGES